MSMNIFDEVRDYKNKLDNTPGLKFPGLDEDEVKLLAETVDFYLAQQTSHVKFSDNDVASITELEYLAFHRTFDPTDIMSDVGRTAAMGENKRRFLEMIRKAHPEYELGDFKPMPFSLMRKCFIDPTVPVLKLAAFIKKAATLNQDVSSKVDRPITKTERFMDRTAKNRIKTKGFIHNTFAFDKVGSVNLGEGVNYPIYPTVLPPELHSRLVELEEDYQLFSKLSADYLNDFTASYTGGMKMMMVNMGPAGGNRNCMVFRSHYAHWCVNYFALRRYHLE